MSDVSLTTLIFELRAALGESARSPRFVRTARDCVVRLDSTRVSRHHARITVDEGLKQFPVSS